MMTKIKALSCFLVYLLYTTTISFAQPAPTPPVPADPIIDLDAIDPQVDPCQDFYRFACGSWIRRFQLPSDRASYARQTDGLEESTTAKLNSILSDYAQGREPVKARYSKELGLLYASCMNIDAIEARSPGFVREQFTAIDGIRSPQDLARHVARLHFEGVNVLFSFYPYPDPADSRMTIAQLDQGGMSFQDKGYYFKTDPKSLEILDRFTKHVEKMLEAVGESPQTAAEDARIIVRLERRIAEHALALEDMQDSTQLHHPMRLQDLTALAPAFDWASYFSASGVMAALGTINVTHPEFFTALSSILNESSARDLGIYLKWQVLHAHASALAKAFDAENFDFWGRYLSGRQEPSQRWKRCTDTAQKQMTDALAEAYVNSFADSDTIRSSAETMIREIKKAFNDNLSTLDWLDSPTRDAARLKLSKVTDKVGFPDRWRSFDGLQLSAGDFIGNVLGTSSYSSRRELDKIGNPTDRTLWDMAPWEQNAYYDPPLNQMVFPLGALVPPIFDLKFSPGANFGSIGGGWMGHELSHGFDSDGRHFDGDGNLVNWWSERTAGEFDRRTQCLVDQANRYEILPGLFINGKQTLTENLADQGGVKVGYLAFMTATGGNPSAPALGPYNERQQYWLAYAQSYCTKETPERVRLIVTTDVHPPAEFRTNAVLFNRPEFAADFGCRVGTRMAPATHCSVW